MNSLCLTIFLFALLLQACSHQQEQTREGLTPFGQARADYLEGLRAMREGDFQKARERLRNVARGPSYIVYTPLARLRLGDLAMLEEKYEEAAENYRAFIQSAAGDPNLHYAYFRLAEATFKAIPADFFLLPPADRKDQTPIRAAMKALTDFIEKFPNSPFVLEAHQMLSKVVTIASSYELEVASFYMSRDKPQAAIRRLKRLIKEVAFASRNEEVRIALIEALAKAKDDEGLLEECAHYKEQFPGGRYRRRAERVCSAIYKASSGL